MAGKPPKCAVGNCSKQERRRQVSCLPLGQEWTQRSVSWWFGTAKTWEDPSRPFPSAALVQTVVETGDIRGYRGVVWRGHHSCRRIEGAGMTENQSHRLSVAPMMDWTDRHCRLFHRQMTRRSLLYTEMVTAPAIVHGPKRGFWISRRKSTRRAATGRVGPGRARAGGADCPSLGYDEVNLNCGCPSDRVQSGCFGAVLMERPPWLPIASRRCRMPPTCR